MKIFLLFTFSLLFISLHSQNSCEEAEAISEEGLYTVSEIDGLPPTSICTSGASSQTAGEWYQFTPTESITVTISTDLGQNDGGDTRLHVFQGSCTDLICVGGDDDSGVLGNGYLSKYTFSAIEGNTYYIVFDNRWQSTGFDFTMSFGDVPPETIINFTPTTVGGPSSYPSLVVDLNGDYLDDIAYIIQSEGNDQLMVYTQNADNTFTESQHVLEGLENLPSWSIAAGDINGDSHNEILIGGGIGVSFLMTDTTQNTYTPVNFSQYVFSQRSNFVDINNDGALDAFVCHDVQPNVYFLNDGEGNLTFYQGGIGDTSQGGNYGSLWTDYDNDGDVDLFIAKCRGGNVEVSLDQMHQNDGFGNFTNVASESNLEDPIQAWSSAWGDFDNDGDMDVLVGANSMANGSHKLKLNNGDGTFTDATADSGWDTFFESSIEFVTYDFDNDGYLDIYTSGGNGIFMRNNGDLSFSPINAPCPVSSIGDLNNDGFLDIYTNGVAFINNANENHWLKVNTIGTDSNSNGIGARITITGPWGMKIREIRSGEGFRYMSSLNAHFGLGEETVIETMTVRWPSGIIDTYTNVTIDETITVTEGETLGVEDVSSTHTETIIYPNPANSVAHIKSSSTVIGYTVYDTLGKIRARGTDTEIEVASWDTGIYIVEILTEDGKTSKQKLVKN